jgi:hypothetical protein
MDVVSALFAAFVADAAAGAIAPEIGSLLDRLT